MTQERSRYIFYSVNIFLKIQYSRMDKKLLFLLFLLFHLYLGTICQAQQEISVGMPAAGDDTARVEFYFRQGYSTFSPSFRNNEYRIDSLLERVALLSRDSAWRMRLIRIVSGASPEGNPELNKRLSVRRGMAVLAYMKKRLEQKTVSFETVSVGVDWMGLTRMVALSDMPYREEVLDILYSAPKETIRDEAVVDNRKSRLQHLHGGQTWQYMEKFFFPDLRRAEILFVYEPCSAGRSEPVTRIPIFQNLFSDLSGTVPSSLPMKPVRAIGGRPVYIGLKTNLLYCVALVPNLGVEFYLGKGWSAGGSWMYAWWKNDRRHYYWRIYGGELVLRKYFGSRAAQKPLTGHHLGVYSQAFTYDYEVGGRGYIGGMPGGMLWNKMNYAVGMEYGYSLPVGHRLILDFVVGAGYWGGEYHKYDPEDGYYVWKETCRRHWFGLTKAEISLVWLVGKGNFNGKGGRK